MPIFLQIKKGVNLQLVGGIDNDTSAYSAKVARVAMTPSDFPGLTPKAEVKPGDTVTAGQPLWHAKEDESVKVVAPVSGTVTAVERGEKRRLVRIVIEAGSKQEVAATQQQTNIKDTIKAAGLWAMMRQLPFDIVPVDTHTPANIFVSAWDSAPLASGYETYLNRPGNIEDLQAGIDALCQLTSGQVFVGFKAGTEIPTLKNTQTVEIKGHYPASLPSVLAANTAPVNKGQTVWLMGAETVVRIGQAVAGKPVDWTFPVAVGGSRVVKPALIDAPAGVLTADLIAAAGGLTQDHNRIISGNVFTGHKVEADEYLRFPYRQLTVIPEGDDKTEFMGWASLSVSKLSSSRSFPSFFFRKRKFNPDARLNGGRRSIIMSGEYDRYIPMDIMAEYLLKAINARDIERMEQLGIYEVTPADFSAAEYADTSKLPLQQIVRDGLDYMLKEVGTAD